ncbi:MAG: ribosomal-processing cysteine protease Prp [Coprobacillus sp.]|nr:ribosomal-processing cysteine protease Prp [Coprobacillus sp.]
MIKVVYTYSNHSTTPVTLLVTGHSGSAEKGEDLICAAVSSIVTGGFNSLQDSNKFSLQLESGYASLVAKEEPSEHDKVVIETMLTSLKTIKESYPQYVSVSEVVTID